MAEKCYKHQVCNDDIVADVSFGFWTSLYSRYQYRALGSTLLDIFENLPEAVGFVSNNPKEIQNMQRAIIESRLREIKNFRNRIAHFDNVCLTYKNEFNETYLNNISDLIVGMIRDLGIDTKIYDYFMSEIKTRSHILENRGAGNA